MAIKIAGTEVINDNRELVLAKLTEIDATIADTAVDIFVYDTSKDSDGGAWRKRTQHTSWYNETLNTATRGSRKEFPAVAVIVAESSQVTIYDGDDPDLPMWMVFNAGSSWTTFVSAISSAGSINSLAMLNGRMVVGKDYGGFICDFLEDNATSIYSSGTSSFSPDTVVSRNSTSSNGTGMIVVVGNPVNDVAMTVLPNAPIDASSGLPTPTIAVATDGGVSVIKDDGTVVDSSSTANYQTIGFLSDYKLVGAEVSGGFSATLFSDYTSDGFSVLKTYNNAAAPYAGFSPNRSSPVGNDIGIFRPSKDVGFSRIYRNPSDETKGMISRVTSSFATGWMNGDIKLATLSDTDDTNVTGSELVTNGNFNNGGDWSFGGGWNFANGQAEIDTTNNDLLSQDIGMVAGKTYTVTLVMTAYTDGVLDVRLGGNATQTATGIGRHTFTGVAGGSTLQIYAFTNATLSIDDISVRLAEEDRSVNGNGLQVFGTVTKSAVATGADLVGYSGFSGTNYLEQPYNSDLDFGTGDFFVTAWVKPDTMTSYNYIFDKSDSDGTNRFAFYVTPSSVAGGAIEFYTPAHPNNYSDPIPTGVWTHVAWARKNNVSYGYINGQLQTQFYSDENLTGDSTAQLYVGVRYTKATSSSLNEGSISLFRISATAPSPEQIKKIYEDEKVLFQENAQATLYGDSDAVTALAYDDSTNLLHVGTSAGRSVFQGLRRVDNTTTAVGAAISASNSMVAED